MLVWHVSCHQSNSINPLPHSSHASLYSFTHNFFSWVLLLLILIIIHSQFLQSFFNHRITFHSIRYHNFHSFHPFFDSSHFLLSSTYVLKFDQHLCYLITCTRFVKSYCIEIEENNVLVTDEFKYLIFLTYMQRIHVYIFLI